MEQEYIGNNCTRHLGQPYLLSNPDELNILADAMENKLGLRYTTHLINCHRHHKGFNAVCKSTVNLAFLGLQPKITRIQKIQHGTRNEGRGSIPAKIGFWVGLRLLSYVPTPTKLTNTMFNPH